MARVHPTRGRLRPRHVMSAWSQPSPRHRSTPPVYPFTQRPVTPTTIQRSPEQVFNELMSTVTATSIGSILLETFQSALCYVVIGLCASRDDDELWTGLVLTMFAVRLYFTVVRLIDELNLYNYFTLLMKLRALFGFIEICAAVWYLWFTGRVTLAVSIGIASSALNIAHFIMLVVRHHKFVLPLLQYLPRQTPLPPIFNERDQEARINYFY